MIPSWLFYTLATLVAWGVWAVFGKLIGEALSASHSQALSTVGVIPVLAALWLVKPWGRGLAPGHPMAGYRHRGVFVALASGVVSSLGNIFYFALLRGEAKAATAIPLTSLYSLVTVLLALAILGERLNRVQVFGIAASLAAIYLFNVPDERGLGWANWPDSLATIGLWGLAGFLQKLSTRDVSARLSAIWFFVGFLPVGAGILVFEPLSGSVSPRVWLLAAAFGFTLALGNFTVLLAYASGGEASIVTPLAGLYPVISVPIAIVGLGERIGWRESLGVALALVAVAAVSMQRTETSAARS